MNRNESAAPPDEGSTPAAVLRRAAAAALFGSATGALFGTAELVYVMTTSGHVPYELPVAALQLGIAAGLGLGAVAALLGNFPSATRHDRFWTRTTRAWAFITVLGALASLAETPMALERWGARAAILWILCAAGAAAALSRPPGRLLRSSPGPSRLLLIAPLLLSFNIAGDLYSRVLPPLLSLTSLTVCSSIALVTAAAVMALDRLLESFGNRLERVSRHPVLCILIPCLLVSALSQSGPVQDVASRRHTVLAAPPRHSRGIPAVRDTPGDVPPRPDVAAAPRAAANTHTDVILVVLDATRADALSPYGAPADLTPALSALAAESAVYDRALAPASWTLPSHATLLTGLYPAQHGADRGGAGHDTIWRPELGVTSPLTPGIDTLATWLEAAGYRTGAVLANAGYLHPDFGLNRGFSFYDARFRLRRRRASLLQPLLEILEPDTMLRLLRWCRPAHEILSEALDWLDEQGDAPVFLLINLMDAHDPYAPEPPFDHRPGRHPGLKDPYLPVSRGERALTEEERIHLTASYQAAVQGMDRALGAFLEGLRARERYDDALLIVVADHGDMLGEHGMLRHARELWEPLVHVPLMVRLPGATSRGRVTTPVHLVDVAPTVLQTIGLPVPELPGQPLPRPGAQPPAPAQRPLLAEVHPLPDDVALLGKQWDKSVSCLYQGTFKYCETSTGSRRLFDLSSDPGELRNLADLRPAMADRIRLELERTKARLHGEGGRRRAAVQAPARPVSAEALDRLRALGYLQ